MLAKKYDRVLEIVLSVILFGVTAYFVWTTFWLNSGSEAYIGNFDTVSLSEGWTYAELEGDREQIHAETVKLPMSITEKDGKSVRLTNTLPDEIRTGMNLCFRSSMQDMRVWIDGELRGSYLAKDLKSGQRKQPSAYFVVELESRDAGKEIQIQIDSKRNCNGIYNEVLYSYGNNVWFDLLSQEMVKVVIAAFVILIGLCAMVALLLIRKVIYESRAILFLAETMIVTGLWILGEAKIRQLYLSAPSFTGYSVYILIAIIVAFAALYFDEVQHHRFHKRYRLIATLVAVQIVLNTLLNFTGVLEYYDTLIFSHAWIALGILITISTIIQDVRTGKIKQYSVIAAGMIVLLIAGTMELLFFYFMHTYSLGVSLGMGLVVLLIATFIQTVDNEIARIEERRQQAEQTTENTITSIARAIDAKDEYTGGHSERVGKYARVLCEAVAKEYGLTEEDSGRIQYIGNMHDIGKIGVPDAVLNKEGKLTDEEFAEMKKHTTIGYEILKDIHMVKGLKSGVRNHHERYDGTGYPDGLKGEQIPLEARILCIADAYDAMSTDRVYRKRLPQEQVIAELERFSGSQFDPQLTVTFLQLIKEGKL